LYTKLSDVGVVTMPVGLVVAGAVVAGAAVVGAEVVGAVVAGPVVAGAIVAGAVVAGAVVAGAVVAGAVVGAEAMGVDVNGEKYGGVVAAPSSGEAIGFGLPAFVELHADARMKTLDTTAFRATARNGRFMKSGPPAGGHCEHSVARALAAVGETLGYRGGRSAELMARVGGIAVFAPVGRVRLQSPLASQLSLSATTMLSASCPTRFAELDRRPFRRANRSCGSRSD